MKYLFLVSILLLQACSEQQPPSSSGEGGANQQFETIMADHWQQGLRRSPVFATSLGVRDYDNQLGDQSLAAQARNVEQDKDFLRQLAEVDVAALSADNQLNHSLLVMQIEENIAAAAFGDKYLLVSSRAGPHLTLATLPDQLPYFNEADYRSYLARLRGIPDYMRQSTEAMSTGMELGWVQPCAPMRGYEKSIQTHLVDDVEQSVFMKPFASRPAAIDAASFEQMTAEARAVIREQVLPAFADFYRFYVDQYAPACRQTLGANALPDGDAYYAHLAGYHTTTDLTPDEIHQIGLDEVARIRAEMEVVIREADFSGSFDEWLAHLRNNPDFYPKTPQERMQAAAVISKKMDGELPRLFGRLPRMSYGLKEIPADIAEKTSTAYYQPSAGDGSRAGFYYLNTSALDTRPLHELEALTLHEAVPGHHFQIALAQELDLPPFRRHADHTAYIEGWGLYSERLGLEVGFYQTPYTNFGRLSYEMWRACRLVVDTGLHSKGWTRQQAIDYMASNTGLSLNNITTEVDRYISWPGQALAYKIGELKIRELRARAEAALGSAFDIRAFHDKLLENGALPLAVLDDVINAWLEQQLAVGR
ncbi:DUF885 domain-containing protein [Porticoccus sp. GXU_MW_L64]